MYGAVVSRMVSNTPGTPFSLHVLALIVLQNTVFQKGDRRGSNPRPSEPQSAVIRFWALPYVAESAYLS